MYGEYLEGDVHPYIELDNVTGLTYGDIPVSVGDGVAIGVVVIISACRVW